MDKFRNVDKNLTIGRILSKPSTSDQQSPIEGGAHIGQDLTLELVNTFLFNLKGETDSTSDNLFIYIRDKQQLKEIFSMANDLFGTFLETFTDHEILPLRKNNESIFLHSKFLGK
jgi:hypothetical protein